MSTTTPGTLDLQQRRQLLRVARQEACAVLGATPPEPAVTPHIEGDFGGAFVTLWAGPMLRGCVGSLTPTSDVVRTVREATREALRDPRFANEPVTADELPRLNLEVSVLSHLALAREPAKLVPGLHGILLRRAGRSGCFLPKVAVECGWSAEEFLANCCTMKAGLPEDAWKDPATQVYLFSADAFSEHSLGQTGRDGDSDTSPTGGL